MGDLPPNNPDFYLEMDKINNPPIEHRLDKYPKMSKEIGGAVIDVKNGVVTIFQKGEIKGETQKETGELNKEMKKEFIEKLKEKSSRQDILKSIEDGTIKVIEIPGNKNLYGLSIKFDLDYIYDLEGNMYINMVRNLDNEYIKFYNIDLEHIGYKVNNEGGKITFIDLNSNEKYTNITKEFYEIIIKAEKLNRKILKGLKDELDKRGIKY